MGSVFSIPFLRNPPEKKSSPYEVLGLKPISTREEIRERFLSLVRSTDRKSKEFQEIVTAHEALKGIPPDLDLYTEEVLSQEIYARDVFKKIGDFSGRTIPEFNTPAFYKALLNFQGRKNQKEEKEEKVFMFKVRKITRIVRNLYKKEEIHIQEVKSKEDHPQVEREVREKEFQCEECKKGFRSKNQLINHFESKRHLKEVSKREKDPKEFISLQIQNLKEGDEEEQRDTKEDERDKSKSFIDPVPPLSPDLPNPQKFDPFINSKGEPVVFRTCSRCKEVFGSRTLMFRHIKEDHLN